MLDQSPFNDITYSLLGDGTAAIYFQVDASTGAVSLRQSVQADTVSTYRVNKGFKGWVKMEKAIVIDFSVNTVL